jgi:hypothetical protein
MWSPARLLLGSGRFKDGLRAELEAEGIEFLGEGVGGSIRYTKFKAPGRRSDGKVQPHRFAVAITRERFVVYCRSGAAELVDSPWDSPNFGWLDMEVTDDGGRLILTVDYDRANRADVAGQVAIHLKTPSADLIASQVEARATQR